MILTIAIREFRSMFLSPLAWTVLAVIQLVLSLYFLRLIESFFEYQNSLTNLKYSLGVTELIALPLFSFSSFIFLIITPIFTMRLISEEKLNKTISLLLSAPVSITEIILGKYIGLLFFISTALTLILLMPLSLVIGTELDFLILFSGIISLFIMLASFSAAGLYMSSLTDNPVISAISTYALLLILFLLWLISSNNTLTPNDSSILSYLSLHTHFSSILSGIINTKDLAYFVLFIFSFIVLSIRQLETQRLQS